MGKIRINYTPLLFVLILVGVCQLAVNEFSKTFDNWSVSNGKIAFKTSAVDQTQGFNLSNFRVSSDKFNLQLGEDIEDKEEEEEHSETRLKRKHTPYFATLFNHIGFVNNFDHEYETRLKDKLLHQTLPIRRYLFFEVFRI